MRRRISVLFGLLSWACASAAQAQLRVEAVETPSAGARAGIHPGDRLISWTRARGTHVVARGRFLHGFDARQFEIEQLPRGGTTVAVSRQGATLTLSLGSGLWGVTTGPGLWGSDANRYQRGRAAADKRDIVRAGEIWGALAEHLSDRNPREAVWLYCRIGTLIVAPVSSGSYKKPDHPPGMRVIDSDHAFVQAEAIAEELKDALLQAHVHERAGAAWHMDVLEPLRASLGRVRKEYGRALQLRERAGGSPLAEAAAAQALGTVWASYDNRSEEPDIVRARQLCTHAVSLRHLHAAGSFEEGYSRLSLALLLFQRFPDERQVAAREVSEAVAILERTAPGSHTLRTSRALAGLLAGDLGDPGRANQLLGLAVPPARHTSVDSNIAGMALFGHHEDDGSLLAIMARSHLKNGNPASAAAVLRLRAVLVGAEAPVFPAVPPLPAPSGTLSPADLLQFARAATASGNTRAAAAFYRELQSLGASSSETPRLSARSTDLACLASAELVALGEGSQADNVRLSTGCQWTTREARGRDPYAEYVLTLARANLRRGDSTTAARLAEQVVSVRRDKPPARWLANALSVLGEARCAAGQRADGISDLVQAARLLAKAGEQLAPEMLTVLGQCESDAGNPRGAERWLREAIRVVEAQSATELTAYLVRAFESSANASAYSELAPLLVRSGRRAEAFRIIEAGRALALRRALSERAVPQPALADWGEQQLAVDEKRRAELWQAYSDTASIARTADGTSTKAQFQSLRPHTLAMELDASESTLRRNFLPSEARSLAAAKGKFAAEVLTVLGALGAGTVLLEYSVARSETIVFVLNPAATAGVSARTLPLPRARVREAANRFRQAIESRRVDDPSVLEREGGNLYEALIAPIEDLIAKSARVLVVADGPLASVPFAALVRHRGSSDQHYFIEWKPVLVAPSAATYVLLRNRPRQTTAKLIVAIGNPATGVAVAASSRGSELADGTQGELDEPFVPRTSARGGSLPGAAEEVRQIGSIEGASARVLVGAEATEGRVRALLSEARVLHFATHAVVNQTFLLDSGLRLADPPSSPPLFQDNGFLQGWEITEQLDVKADLVTLSACESATGVALPGEGAMSIGRAFHAAGARSVVSALWPIDDNATAKFMAIFYRALHAGIPKVDALRQAQLSFIREGAGRSRYMAPQFWAAFQLSGDWQ